MSMFLHREIELLQHKMLDLGGCVEDAVRRAIHALETHDTALARRVEEEDAALDADEVALEEECLKVLALHQPVAMDLRVIVSILKINNDLERIGDFAVAIARCARPAGQAGDPPWPEQLPALTSHAMRMVSGVLDAFVRLDGRAARVVCLGEEEFKSAFNALRGGVSQTLRETREAGVVDAALDHLAVGRSLQRICGHAVNIAEDVIYMLEGVVVRHKHQAIQQP
ncbi:MAG: phosphate signaling complex protein PhoU [Kiritimatiellaeota bacterium]|nr:phosphate signaling complex protein PhoU [Kiritimatiellota bacterium]